MFCSFILLSSGAAVSHSHYLGVFHNRKTRLATSASRSTRGRRTSTSWASWPSTTTRRSCARGRATSATAWTAARAACSLRPRWPPAKGSSSSCRSCAGACRSTPSATCKPTACRPCVTRRLRTSSTPTDQRTSATATTTSARSRASLTLDPAPTVSFYILFTYL